MTFSLASQIRSGLILGAAIVACLAAAVPDTALGQKTDLITMRNGDIMTGEVKWLDSGRLEVSTDAMGTVNVKWPRILTLTTDKAFEIVLDDETVYFGSLQAAAAGRVVILTDGGSFDVPIQRVVRMHRLASGFWASLDGDIGVGFDFTQQNSKTDFTVHGDLKYPRKANLTRLRFDTTFSRQNGTEDLFRLDATLAHLRQFSGRWFYLGFLSGARNSQLSLDYRAGGGGGIGRLLIETNRSGLAVWAGPSLAAEQYSSQESAVTFPLGLVTTFQFFVWEPLSTDIQGQLGILPILNDGGRWRIDFSIRARRELVSDVYLAIGVNELYDSRPPDAEANNNDLSLNTSLGIDF